MNTPEREELPEPAFHFPIAVWLRNGCQILSGKYFTEGQMLEYGRLCRAGREHVVIPPKLRIHASGGLSGFNDYRCGDKIITMSAADALKWNDSIDEVERNLRRLSPQAGGSDE